MARTMINSAIPIIHVVRITAHLAIPICIILIHIVARFDFAIVIHFVVAYFRICRTIRMVIYFIIVPSKILKTFPVVIHLEADHFAIRARYLSQLLAGSKSPIRL